MAEIVAPVITPDSGQGAAPAGAGQAGSSGSAFFTSPDGKAYATKDELANDWKESYLRREDYSRKTMTLADERKKHEKEREDFKKEQERVGALKDEYGKFDKMVRSRPDVYAEMKQRLQRGPSVDTFAQSLEQQIEEKYGGKFKEFEDYMKNQQAQTERDRAFKTVKDKYADVDEDLVMNMLDEISSGDFSTLVEALHWATKGRSLNPATVAKKVAQHVAGNRGVGLPSGSGQPISDRDSAPKTIDEARDRLMRQTISKGG